MSQTFFCFMTKNGSQDGRIVQDAQWHFAWPATDLLLVVRDGLAGRGSQAEYTLSPWFAVRSSRQTRRQVSSLLSSAHGERSRHQTTRDDFRRNVLWAELLQGETAGGPSVRLSCELLRVVIGFAASLMPQHPLRCTPTGPAQDDATSSKSGARQKSRPQNLNACLPRRRRRFDSGAGLNSEPPGLPPNTILRKP